MGVPAGQGRSHRLPRRAALLYASGSLGAEALTQSRGLWLLFYYAPPEDADLEALLPLGVVGALLFAGGLAEALLGPPIAHWSDRTRSRLGRRLPFILGATPFWALFAFLLFTPPADAGVALTAAYLLLTLELFHLAGTLSGGPYEALLPEIARTSPDRLRIVGARVYFGAAGGGIGVIGSGFLIDAAGFHVMALAMALVALIFRSLGMAGVWRHASRTQPPVPLTFRRGLRETFANVHFRRFLPTFVLFQVGLHLLLGTLPFYVTAVLEREEGGAWVGILAGVGLGSTLVTVPLFLGLAGRSSKRHAYRSAMLAAALAFPLLFFAGFVPLVPREPQVLACMALMGAPIAGVYLFPAALIADIVDEEGARTGLRREASYFAAQDLVEKVATSLAPLLLAALLTIGNTADDPLGVRLVGPVAGALVLWAALLFRAYDLPDEVVAPQGAGGGEA
jgi:GPH family glycoside/pentoside/hexuronide:cation symporter